MINLKEKERFEAAWENIYGANSGSLGESIKQIGWRTWQAAKQSEWQPIETIPKDREILILSNLNNRYVGIWAMNVETGNEAFIIGNDGYGNQMVVEFENIKIWYELPQPPKEQS